MAEWVANSVDPDQTPRYAASDLGLHCLLSLVCPKTKSKCGRPYLMRKDVLQYTRNV